MNRRELLKALSAIPLSPMILNGKKAWAHGTTINAARKPQQQVRPPAKIPPVSASLRKFLCIRSCPVLLLLRYFHPQLRSGPVNLAV